MAKIGPASLPTVTTRTFKQIGEHAFSFACDPAGIVFEVGHLRRESRNLKGEIRVSVNGHFSAARTIMDGVLLWGDLNFSALRSRSEVAKALAQRSGIESLDWHGFVEELAFRLVENERQGQPAVVLADIETPTESVAEWVVGDFPLLKDLPMVLFGDSGSGKSYFSMWLAGMLARAGVAVLYADWEFVGAAHKKRLNCLFQPMPRNLYYVRCERPFVDEIGNLSRLVHQHGCQYLICDSIGWALDGPAESQEAAASYFRTARQLRVGSLHIAHIPKNRDDGKQAEIFGSTFFRAGARATWFIEKASDNPPSQLRFGIHNRKNQDGPELAPRAYAIHFEGATTRIERLDLESVEELTAQLPLLQRLQRACKYRARSIKEMAEETGATEATIRAALSRHRKHFVKNGSSAKHATYGLAADGGLEF